MRKRSHEPVFWALFGAGGVFSAMFAPAVVFLTGLAIPLGLLKPQALNFDRIHGAVSSLPGSLFLFIMISLLLWHAMHRINHSLHDFGIDAGMAGKVVCYGCALAGTVVTGYFLATIMQPI